jgi:signal transduction histidine kinase
MSVDTPVRRQRERSPMIHAMLALTTSVVLAGGTCLWVVAATPAAGRASVAWFGGATVTLLAVVAAIAAHAVRTSHQRLASLSVLNADVDRLVDHVLPALAGRLRAGDPAGSTLAELSRLLDVAHHGVLRVVADEIGRSERMRAAATSACANAAGRVQALTTSMLADLREMEGRHSEEVLGDLLKLDHSTAQAGRLVDSIAVLTGARSGRRWTKPIVMESILRGAMGRIRAYQRVRVHSTSTVAVAGYAAEGVMHALAELMDNATSFSPPAEEVHLYTEEVQAGVVITIEDGGFAMSREARHRAERMVSAEPLDLTTLSGTRLGLAVVGRLAHKYGLKVFFRPSSRGGTGVVVTIPRQLITRPSEDDAAVVPPSADGSAPPTTSRAVATQVEHVARDEAASEHTGTAPELPKRPRGQTLARASRTAENPPETKPALPRADAGTRFNAFRQASRGLTPDGQTDNR